MPQTGKAHSALLLVAREIKGKIEADRAQLRSDRVAEPTLLESIDSLLQTAIDAALLEDADAARRRAEDLDLIDSRGSLSDDRVVLLIHVLLQEFGPNILSNEGLTRLASCMLDPGEA